MTNSRASDGQSLPYAIDISHLRDEQRQLLVTVLRAGEVAFTLTRQHLLADTTFADEVDRAVAWVGAPEYTAEPEFDDLEYSSSLPPLVKPSRAPLPDGRLPATRWRRLGAGVIDEVLVGVPTGLAARADLAIWALVAMHMVYFVVPTGSFGWSIGKLLLRTRVVDATNHRVPSLWRAAVRWAIPFLPVLAALTLGLPADAMGLLIGLLYLPIMLDLRGWHDRAANTLVVERR